MKQKSVFVTTVIAVALLAQTAYAGSAIVTWNANSESDLAGYKIYYGTGPRTGTDPKSCGSCGYSASVNTGKVTTYTFNNLTDGPTYYFSLTAYDTSNNESAFSSEASKSLATPPVISNLAAVNASPASIQITWATNVSTNAQVKFGLTTAYNQQSSVVDNSPKTTSHNITLTGLSGGTTYHYQVVSADSYGNIIQSSDNTFTTPAAAIPDTTPPATVQDLAPQNITQTSVDLVTWTAPGDDGNIGTAAQYDLRYSNTAVSDANFDSSLRATGLPLPLPAGTKQTYTLVGLAPETTYSAALKTADETGNWSVISNIVSFTTLAIKPDIDKPADTTPPPQVTDVKASGLDSQISLRWVNPSQDQDYIRTIVVRKEGATAPTSATDGVKIYEGVSTFFTDTGLTNGKTYSYSIFTIDRVPNYSLAKVVTAIPLTGVQQEEVTTVDVENPSNPSQTTIRLKLINSNGTYYLIQNGIRHGITLPGMLFSYGFALNQAKLATSEDTALPEGDILLPGDGVLVKTATDKTVWLISGNQRHGFTSATVFTALGFKFSQVLVVTSPELNKQARGDNVSDSTRAHLPGINIKDGATIYWIDYNYTRHPYPSLDIYNSWNVPNDFSRVLPANAADRSLPIVEPVTLRTLD